MNTNLDRRTLVRGAAWTLPAVTIAATAPALAASACTVDGGIRVGPNVDMTPVRAICQAQSQYIYPGTLSPDYGYGLLPRTITICSCDGLAGWYRWRETDTLSEFQIEVDGLHNDQNSQTQGYRPPFFLSLENSCRVFALTYRTSQPRSTNRTNFQITWTLQKGPTQNGPWSTVDTITRSVDVRRRRQSDSTNFNSCSAGGTSSRVTGDSHE